MTKKEKLNWPLEHKTGNSKRTDAPLVKWMMRQGGAIESVEKRHLVEENTRRIE